MPTIATITGRSTPQRNTTTRIEFVQQRNVVLGRQRDDAMARLAKLRSQVAKISTAISAGDIANPAHTMAVLERYAAKERSLLADVERLNGKIGS